MNIGRDIGNELKKDTKLSAAAATHMKVNILSTLHIFQELVLNLGV